jgi:O-antigen/teichoic acid export membrane protein
VPPAHGRRHFTRRLSWTLVDQMLSSLSNMVGSVGAAHLLTVDQFGVVGVPFILYLLALQVPRALCSQPFMIRFSRIDRRWLRPGTMAAREASAGLTVIAGTLGSFCAILAGLIAEGALATSLFSLAVLLPGLLLQDSLRYVLFADGRPQLAAGLDAIWLLLSAACLLVLATIVDPSPASVLLAWGVGGVISAVVGLAVLRLRPSFTRSFSWLRSQWDLGGRFLADALVLTGSRQVIVLLLGTVASLTALAAARGSITVLAPLTVLVTGVGPSLVPEGVGLGESRRPEFYRLLCFAGLGLLIASTLWLVILWFDIGVGELLLGDTWAVAVPAVWAWGAAQVATAVSVPAISGLQVMQRARTLLRLRMLLVALSTPAALVAGSRWGATGAGLALALANWATLPLFWIRMQRAVIPGARGGSAGGQPGVPQPKVTIT